MDFHALTLGERTTYSGANGLTLLVAFMAMLLLGLDFQAVAALAVSAAAFGLVLAAALAAGLWLTAWSLLVYDLVQARDRWIGSLVFLATLGCLLAAWADSLATLIGAAVLLFIFWLPHMATESAWQAIRVRAYVADARRLTARLAPLTQVLLAVVDVGAFAATALLLAATFGDGAHGRRSVATIALVTPFVFVLAVRRARCRPMPEPATGRKALARRMFACPNVTLTARRRHPGR